MLRLCAHPSRRCLILAAAPVDIPTPLSIPTADPVHQKRPSVGHLPREASVKVAADVAYHVAMRHVGLVQLPQDIDHTLDAAILGAGLRGRRLRRIGNRLMEHLRSLSSSRSRGGLFGWNEIEARRSKQKIKREMHVLADAVTSKPIGFDTHPSEVIQAGRQLTMPWKTSGFITRHDEDPGLLIETPSPSYEEMTTAAWAATRFPGNPKK